MSLIFGINLSDKIFLAADTRVSHLMPSGKISWVADKVMKIEVLSDDLAVACAGDVSLIKYLILHLRKESFLNKGVACVRQEIEAWVAKQVNNFLKRHSYAKACFIFGGIDRSKKKVINGKRLIQLVKDFQEKKNVPMVMNPVIFQGLSSKPNVPNPDPELPIANSMLFSVATDAKNFRLDVTDTQWGEYLINGPKELNKNKVPSTFFGQLEFEVGADNLFRSQALLTALIRGAQEDQGLLTVGGPITVMAVGEKTGTVLVTGKIWRKNLNSPDSKEELVSNTEVVDGKLCYQKPNGEYEIITDISKYSLPKGSFYI